MHVFPFVMPIMLVCASCEHTGFTQYDSYGERANPTGARELLAMLTLANKLGVGVGGHVYLAWHHSPAHKMFHGNMPEPRKVLQHLAGILLAFAGRQKGWHDASWGYHPPRHEHFVGFVPQAVVEGRARATYEDSLSEVVRLHQYPSRLADAVMQSNETADNENASAVVLDSQTAARKEKVAMFVDLGDDGEPKGKNRMLFKPNFERSEFIMVDLQLPLGIVIQVMPNGNTLVQGAYPGFRGFNTVQPGDLIRGLTGYRETVGGAPMWRQLISYGPVGTKALRRLFFKTEGATYPDIRDAVRSHRVDDGGNGIVTLVLEREVNSSMPMTPRAVPTLAPLKDVLLDDLGAEYSADDMLEKTSVAERARQLFDEGSQGD